VRRQAQNKNKNRACKSSVAEAKPEQSPVRCNTIKKTLTKTVKQILSGF
jgi:hypothetical protein